MIVYDSLLDVPLDTYDGDDADDSVISGAEGIPYEPPVRPMTMLVSVQVTAQNLVAPYFLLKPGSRGKPVTALNRGLSRAGYRRWQQFSPIWNPWVTKSLKKFQKDHKLAQTGIYNRETHQKLARYYDAYSIKHLLQASIPKITPEEKKRQAFLAELMYIYNRRWNIFYSQRRPFDIFKPPRGLDCSASGEWGCKYAGIPSPSGYSSYGWGNTWSQKSRLDRLGRRTSTQDAEVGDFVFYGSGGPTHVAYWIGGMRVWSFGSYPAKILDIFYRSDYLGIYNLMG